MHEKLYDIVLSTNKDVIVTHIIWMGFGKTKEEITDKLYELKVVVLGLNFDMPNVNRYVDTSRNIDIELYHRQ